MEVPYVVELSAARSSSSVGMAALVACAQGQGMPEWNEKADNFKALWKSGLNMMVENDGGEFPIAEQFWWRAFLCFSRRGDKRHHRKAQQRLILQWWTRSLYAKKAKNIFVRCCSSQIVSERATDAQKSAFGLSHWLRLGISTSHAWWWPGFLERVQ